MRIRFTYLVMWALLGSPLAAGYAPVAEAGEPLEKVRQTVNNVLDIVANKDLSEQEREAKIREAVLQRFGFEEMAKRALSRHWHNRTPQERQEFVQLLTDLLANSYVEKIEQSKGKEAIKYTKETIEDGIASVHAEIVQERDANITVNYRLLQRDGDWQVYDVVIEGVSLVNNYRTQFNKIILENSYEELVKKMQLKSEQLQAITNTTN